MNKIAQAASLEAERLRTSQLLDLAAFSPKLAQHFVLAGYTVDQAKALVEIIESEMTASDPEAHKAAATVAFYNAATTHAARPVSIGTGFDTLTQTGQILSQMTPNERAAFEQKVADRVASSGQTRATIEARLLEIRGAASRANDHYTK
jgi:hypothetical protein